MGAVQGTRRKEKADGYRERDAERGLIREQATAKFTGFAF